MIYNKRWRKDKRSCSDRTEQTKGGEPIVSFVGYGVECIRKQWRWRKDCSAAADVIYGCGENRPPGRS